MRRRPGRRPGQGLARRAVEDLPAEDAAKLGMESPHGVIVMRRSSQCPPRPSCDLNCTGADAWAFAESMEKRLGALHENVVRRVLVNGGGDNDASTAANIINALGILGRPQPNDTVAVFLQAVASTMGRTTASFPPMPRSRTA